jgi:hypothetical protein
MKTKLNKLILLSFGLITVTAFYSCKKEGTGGKASVSGTVYHHEAPIASTVVYIKYGATEFPGVDPALYDNSVTADANAHYEFKDLQKGDYYLYGVGYDKGISKIVQGGIGIRLKNKQAFTSDVPVTED